MGKHKNKNKKFDKNSNPYKGWNLYFTSENFLEGSLTSKKIETMTDFINDNLNLFPINSIMEKEHCVIDINHLYSNQKFNDNWKSFKEDLFDQPEHTLNCMGMALHQTCANEKTKENYQKICESGIELDEQTVLENINVDIDFKIYISPINYCPIVLLKDLKVNYYGKLVTIQGTVIRCAPAKLLAKKVAFRCNSCATDQVVDQIDGIYKIPTRCPGMNCRAKKFTPLLTSNHTKTVDWQVIKVQESVQNQQLEGGRVPRVIEVELTSHLVDTCVPGDNVKITGIVKVHDNADVNTKNQTANMYLLYLDAVSLVNDKLTGNKHNTEGIEFVMKDYYMIQAIHGKPALTKLLVQSLCPTIFGHEIIKLGLLLGLFSGGQQPNGNRSDSHILMVGDPGLGKSQLLQSCANVAPRGVYVCGNTSTSSGLTVTLTRESGNDFGLEAGALVLADQGICCIDEFDKMGAQHQALLEAMEQQTISIAKGGVVCTLSARCGILAAANPVQGHYNRAKTVSENIHLGPSLLSRFDIVFLLLDQPDSHLDSLLSEHVLGLHTSTVNTINQVSLTSQKVNNFNSDLSLRNRLQQSPGEKLDLIPSKLLRKYIAYARRYVHPSLSTEAANVLQNFYMKLRKKHQTINSTPITTRQLQAMIRLTQARAKLELREIATGKDAQDIIEIMRHSLIDVFSDQFGHLHFDRSQNGCGMSGRSKCKQFLNALMQESVRKGNNKFNLSEIQDLAAKRYQLNKNDSFNIIDSLNLQGFLIKKSKDLFELSTI